MFREVDMARYIDADRFIEWLDVGHLRSPSEKCLSENDVKAMIELQPTVNLDNDKEFMEYIDSFIGAIETLKVKLTKEDGSYKYIPDLLNNITKAWINYRLY